MHFQNEAIYLHPLDEDVTTLSLQTFLLNFTNGDLRRNLTSGKDVSSGGVDGCFSSSSTSCIVEVTADTFEQIVLDSSKVSSV